MTQRIIPQPDPSLAPDRARTTAYAASLVAKATGGVLYGLAGYNSGVAAQFIQIHDSATLPADGAVPAEVITVPPSSNFSIDFGAYGCGFGNGITVCNSSTGPTKTIGAANCWFSVRMK